MSSRGAQITLFSFMLFFALVVAGLNGYVTGLYYGAFELGGYGVSGGVGGYETYTTYMTRYGTMTYTTSSYDYTRTSDYTLDPYTRFNGDVVYNTYWKYGYTTWYTTYTTTGFGAETGYFVTSGYRYKKRDALPTATGPSPAVTTATSQPTPSKPEVAPVVGPTTLPDQPTALEQAPLAGPTAPAVNAAGVHELVKRKKKKGGSSSGGGKTASRAAKRVPLIVIQVWAIFTVIYAIVFLSVSGPKPRSKCVAVNTDLWFLAILFAIGLGGVASWTSALMSVGYWQGGEIIFAAMGVSWILLVLILATFLFEWIHVSQKYPGKENKKKSLKTLVQESKGPKYPAYPSGIDPNMAMYTAPQPPASYAPGTPVPPVSPAPYHSSSPPPGSPSPAPYPYQHPPPGAPAGGQWVYQPDPNATPVGGHAQSYYQDQSHYPDPMAPNQYYSPQPYGHRDLPSLPTDSPTLNSTPVPGTPYTVDSQNGQQPLIHQPEPQRY